MGAGTSQKHKLNLPRPHGKIHPFFHRIGNTRWVILINLAGKTDGDFFPEVNSSAFSQKEPTCLLQAVHLAAFPQPQLVLHALGSMCKELCLDPRRPNVVLAWKHHLQMPLLAPLPRHL